MPWVDSLDYLDLNSLRRYPIRENTSVVSQDGVFQIPDNLIVDFSLSASNDISKRFYISRIFNKLFSCTIDIADYSNYSIVGSFEIDFNKHKLNDTYYLSGVGDYVGANGKITIGRGNDLQLQPAGNFTFNPESTEFETRTIIPGLAGVSSIKYIDSKGSSRTLTGAVTMQARSNMAFSFDALSNTVAMDVGDNLGLNKICTTNNCVKRINGVAPEPTTGNISFIGMDCMQVSSSAAYTIKFEDTCCTPCSGCSDLSTLTTRLTSLENSFIDLKNYYSTLNGQLTNYLTTVNSNCSC
jgi:hypothetical protein